MKIFKYMPFASKIKWRIRGLWCLLIAMLAYMVAVGEMGLGDSRTVGGFAKSVGSLIFFGSLIWVIHKIVCCKRLLKYPALLKNQLKTENDEFNRYIYDKSGGAVWDIIFVSTFFITMTAALIDRTAFYTAFAIFMVMALAKSAAYLTCKYGE